MESAATDRQCCIKSDKCEIRYSSVRLKEQIAGHHEKLIYHEGNTVNPFKLIRYKNNEKSAIQE